MPQQQRRHGVEGERDNDHRRLPRQAAEPGLGPILTARVLAEFSDKPIRYNGSAPSTQ